MIQNTLDQEHSFNKYIHHKAKKVQETSLDAYFDEKKNHNNQKSLITNLLSVYGTLTNKEISRISKLETSSVSGRVNDLRKEGLVTFCEKRICSISGKRVNAWRLIQ